MESIPIGSADGPTNIYVISQSIDWPATIASMSIIIMAAAALVALLLWVRKKWLRAKQS